MLQRRCYGGEGMLASGDEDPIKGAVRGFKRYHLSFYLKIHSLVVS